LLDHHFGIVTAASKSLMAKALSRRPRAHRYIPRGIAETQLEKIASEVGAGLVVAGAYGHSRFHEWVFGGVTKRLLNPSKRCTLLSR
jgi:nucleotide-binding universal stress UspA family protein